MKIRFQNKTVSEVTIPGWAVMRPIGITTNNNEPILTMDQPNNHFERLYYINGPQPVPSGAFGSCFLDFPVYALYDDNDGADTITWNSSWGAVADEWTLGKHHPGFTMLGNKLGDDETSPKRAIVRPEIVNEVWVVLSDPLVQGQSVANQPVYIGKPQDDGGPETDSGLVLPQLYDRLIDVDTMSGWELPAGAWCLCRYLDGFWYVVESSKCARLGSGS